MAATQFAKDTTPEDNGLVFAPDPTVNPPLPAGRWKRTWSNAQRDGLGRKEMAGRTTDALKAAAAAVNEGKSRFCTIKPLHQKGQAGL